MNKKINKNGKLDLKKVSGGADVAYINNVIQEKDGTYRLANYNNNLKDYVTISADPSTTDVKFSTYATLVDVGNNEFYTGYKGDMLLKVTVPRK